MREETNEEQIDIDEMSDKDLIFEIMHLVSQDTITRKHLQQVLEAARQIAAEPDRD